jgi:hypothetical protein
MISFPEFREEVVMLERYFIRPTAVDRIRASGIGGAIMLVLLEFFLDFDGFFKPPLHLFLLAPSN